MQYLGDITKINGAEIEPVDVITFGSPCQDLSVAGKRAGLEGARSGLFMEAVRIIKEMRNESELRNTNAISTNSCGRQAADIESREPQYRYSSSSDDVRPRYAVWENVPGAYSSNKGEDFRAVLEELAKVKEDVTIPRPDQGKWSTAGCIMGNGWSIAWRTLDAQYWGVPQRRRRIFLVCDFGGNTAPEILFKRTGLRRYTSESGETREGTTSVVERGVNKTICFEPRSQDGVHRIHGEISPTINTAQGGQRQPCVMVENNILPFNTTQITSPTNGNNPKYGDPCHTLASTDHPPAIIQKKEPTYCLQGNGIDRADTAGCNGKGWTEDVCYTLNTIDRPAVTQNVFTLDRAAFNQGENALYDFQIGEDGKTQTVIARGPNAVAVEPEYMVRRLTVLECERLQGFPDGWTDITYKGKPASDSGRYKALGNSVAIPCVEYVAEGIAEIIQNGTIGSLFDGIGGFPLAFSRYGYKPIWASEIEPFPIAVTKERFGAE